MGEAFLALRTAMGEHAEPRPDAADELLGHLEERLGDLSDIRVLLEGDAAGGARHVERARRTLRLRARLALALATVIAILGAGIAFEAGRRPERASAQSIVEDARERAGALPPFTAEVFKRLPLDDIEQGGVELTYRLEYWDDTHWRTTVLSSSLEHQPDEVRRAWPERTGDFTVADGELLGVYQSKAKRLLVSPIEEMQADTLASMATVGLATQLSGYEGLDAALATGDCRTGETTFVGRGADTVECRVLGKLWNGVVVIDSKTKMLLRMTHDVDDFGNPDPERAVLEVRELDLSPGFAGDSFETAPPSGATAVWTGSTPAPAEYAVRGSDAVSGTIDVPGARTVQVVADADAVWVMSRGAAPDDCACAGEATLSKIDPRTHDVLLTITVPEHAVDLAVADGTVWLGAREIVDYPSADRPQRDRTTVYSYDAGDGRQRHPPIVTDRSGPTAEVVAGGGSVWSTGGPVVTVGSPDTFSAGYLTLQRIEPGSGKVVQEVQSDGMYASGLTAGDDHVWFVATEVDQRDPRQPTSIDLLVGLDARSGAQVARFPLAGLAPHQLVASRDQVWGIVAGADEQERASLVRYDTATGREVARSPIGFDPIDLVFAAGSLWVTDRQAGTVARHDPTTLEELASIRVGGMPGDLEHAHDALWVADLQEPRVSRIDV